MLLKHKNLSLRSATVDDAKQLETWWNDGRVMAHAGLPFGSGEKAEEIAGRISRETDDSRRLILELGGRPIGEMNYGPNDEDSAWIGIKICEVNQQDHGLGKQYLSMLIRWLLEDFGYKKITLDTNLNNKRAQHVYERLGFKKVQVRENTWTDQLGVPQSFVDYELVPEDFVDFAK